MPIPGKRWNPINMMHALSHADGHHRQRIFIVNFYLIFDDSMLNHFYLSLSLFSMWHRAGRTQKNNWWHTHDPITSMRLIIFIFHDRMGLWLIYIKSNNTKSNQKGELRSIENMEPPQPRSDTTVALSGLNSFYRMQFHRWSRVQPGNHKNNFCSFAATTLNTNTEP